MRTGRWGHVCACASPQNRIPADIINKLNTDIRAALQAPEVQERLTQQIAEAITEAVAPRGLGVLCEAQHFCMMMRGVEKQESSTVTSAMLGEFRERKETRDEFLSLIRGR